ncbi:MAG: lytic murein transglycosylase [Bacteroidota bacterium]|nr:lytic murein transglycosylase [Bacteroidota bacterium]
MARGNRIAASVSLSILVVMGTIEAMLLSGCSTLEPTVRARIEKVRAILAGADERFAPTVYRLLERGIDSAWLWVAFHHPETKFLPDMLKINVTGFLRKVDYSHNWSDASIRACRAFMDSNRAVLAQYAELYRVPPEIITAVLWVETKFGRYTGIHHVWSVYASLATADEPENIRTNQQVYRDTIADPVRLAMLDSLVEVRSRRKAAWAIEQLVALSALARDSTLDVLSLRGSWAGAFGLPQFIPTSYKQWAQDGDGDGRKDLFSIADAIASVAYYLHANGWRDSPAAQQAALFHYNNSRDYVECILTVAQRLRQQQ